MAKNAVVLPMLIRVNNTAVVVTRQRAFSGIRRVGCTYIIWISKLEMKKYTGDTYIGKGV